MFLICQQYDPDTFYPVLLTNDKHVVLKAILEEGHHQIAIEVEEGEDFDFWDLCQNSAWAHSSDEDDLYSLAEGDDELTKLVKEQVSKRPKREDPITTW